MMVHKQAEWTVHFLDTLLKEVLKHIQCTVCSDYGESHAGTTGLDCSSKSNHSIVERAKQPDDQRI